MPAGTQRLLLAARWENPQLNVPLQLRDPTGRLYTEADIAVSTNMSVIAAFSDAYGKVIGVRDPAAGRWEIIVPDTAGLGQVTFNAYRDSSLQSIAVNAPATDVSAQPGVTVQYTAIDPGVTGRVSLFYDTTGQGRRGTSFAVDLPENDGPGSYTWDPTGLPVGDYYVYAILEDGVNPPVFSPYATGKVRVVNPPAGTVSGTIYDDLNGNRVRDEGELGLAGWTVYADANSNGALDAGEVSALTDAAGAYRLTLPIGHGYSLLLLPKTESFRTGPTPPEVVFPQARRDLPGHDIGVFRLARLSGVVFDDLNDNGMRNSQEPGLAGQTVYLDLNLNNRIDNGELSTLTDAQGRYQFENLGSSTMTVAQVVADGWRTVTPMTLRLASGAFLTNADLANFKLGTIRGQVYDDANANGIKDAGESGLSGVVVFLDATDNGQLDFGESSAVSDAQGRYAFLSLTPGNYRVRQIALVGSYQSPPYLLAGYALALSRSGELFDSQDFGNRPARLLNGGFDVTDPASPLFGWKVRGAVTSPAARPFCRRPRPTRRPVARLCFGRRQQPVAVYADFRAVERRYGRRSFRTGRAERGHGTIARWHGGGPGQHRRLL